MRAKSIKGKSSEEIQSALQQSMTDGFKPTLAIAFISVKQDRKAICKLLDEKALPFSEPPPMVNSLMRIILKIQQLFFCWI